MITTRSSNEQERVSELDSYTVLDTPAETSFDQLTSLAAHICMWHPHFPGLVDKDRMWFKSKVGIGVSEIPRIDGFCSSAISDEVVLVVPDSAANPRLANHPLAAVSEYAAGFAKRSGLNIQVEISPEVGRLSENIEITLFRIIQEALGNVHRHSGSTAAVIRILCLENDVVLEIQDRGRGLPFPTSRYGVGIKSMQERLRQ